MLVGHWSRELCSIDIHRYRDVQYTPMPMNHGLKWSLAAQFQKAKAEVGITRDKLVAGGSRRRHGAGRETRKGSSNLAGTTFQLEHLPATAASSPSTPGRTHCGS